MEKEILEILKNIQGDINGLKEGQKRLEDSQKRLEDSQKRLESKVESISEQTANLLEFREDTTSKLNKLSGKIKFQTHKLTETEEEIFGIKDHLKIIK